MQNVWGNVRVSVETVRAPEGIRPRVSKDCDRAAKTAATTQLEKQERERKQNEMNLNQINTPIHIHRVVL